MAWRGGEVDRLQRLAARASSRAAPTKRPLPSQRRAALIMENERRSLSRKQLHRRVRPLVLEALRALEEEVARAWADRLLGEFLVPPKGPENPPPLVPPLVDR